MRCSGASCRWRQPTFCAACYALIAYFGHGADRQIGVGPRVYARSVNFAAGPPSKWLLTMTDGSDIEVWADGYSEEAGDFVFSVLVDATAEEQHQLEVTGRTPTRPERVIVTVCRLPASAVTGPPASA